ncbi:hypothetical protein V6N13_099957 [Hibiscus sabdariffa]|uniref:RNase H type-1 domain-containing protein n=1 Tax=Hibiscus sabdariffa TaxID=183260 RepID=A0ABR2NLC9_9ROSI
MKELQLLCMALYLLLQLSSVKIWLFVLLYLPRVLEESVVWQVPADDVIKFNFDSTYDILSKKSISGVIARDSSGLIMASCIVPHYHVADAFVAEAFACL